MKRVFGNLISNAIKFTNPGGNIVIDLNAESNRIFITVKDNGIGIPDQMKKDLFLKYSKAGRRGTGGERSIGLGMYIIKSILDVHHAKISVVSEEHKGSVFVVELPRSFMPA